MKVFIRSHQRVEQTLRTNQIFLQMGFRNIDRPDSNKVIFSQSGIREGVLFATIEELTNQHVLNPEARQLTIDAD